MTSSASQTRSDLLRTAALIAALAGSAGSAAFLLRAGQQTSRLLLGIMMIWVLSPFITVAMAAVVSKRWSARAQAILYSVMLLHAPGTLAVYTYNALNPPKAQAGFFFVVVPLVSWVLLAIVVPVVALLSGRRSATDG